MRVLRTGLRITQVIRAAGVTQKGWEGPLSCQVAGIARESTMTYTSQSPVEVCATARQAAPWVVRAVEEKAPAVTSTPEQPRTEAATLRCPGEPSSNPGVAAPSGACTDGRREPGPGLFGRALAAILGEISGSRRRETASAGQIDRHTLRDIGVEPGRTATRRDPSD